MRTDCGLQFYIEWCRTKKLQSEPKNLENDNNDDVSQLLRPELYRLYPPYR